MAKKCFVYQIQQSMGLILAITGLTIMLGIPVIAQQPTDEPRALLTPQVPQLPNTMIPLDYRVTMGIDQPLGNTDEIYMIPSKQVRPAHSHYFLIQYTQQFDDNVLLREKNRVSDLVSIPQIGFGLTQVKAHSLIHLEYLGGAEIHQQFSAFNGVRQSLEADLQENISKRGKVFITEHFFQRPLTSGFGAIDSSSNLTGATLNLLVPTRTITNEITLGVEYQTSKYATLRASYSNALARFNNPLLINTTEHKLELDYKKQFSRTKSYELIYRTSIFAGKQSLMTHTFLPSLIYRPNNSLNLQFGLGPQFLASAINSRKLFLATQAALSYQKAKTTYSVTYTSGIGTGGGLATVTENKTVFGTIQYLLSERWQTELRLGYSHAQNSLNTLTSPLVLTKATNSELVISSRTDYLVVNQASLFFEYLHSKQNSTGTLVSKVNRNLFSLGLQFDTRRPTRESKRTHF